MSMFEFPAAILAAAHVLTAAFSGDDKDQCDQIVAKTPNLDVLGVQMSLIFGKCRLAFFVTFKAKMAFFLAFFNFD